MTRFNNKKVLVTGGSGGIGLATAKRLVQEGARVAITGRNEEKLNRAAEEIGAIAIRNDAAEVADADRLASAVREQLGGLDAVFINAGSGRPAPLGDVTADDFDAQFAVNVRGPLLQLKALAPILEDGGAVVLNTSIAREKGMAGFSIYSATKGALRTLTRALARELSPRNIRVNAVSPGPVATGFFDATGMPQEAIEGFVEEIATQVPLGRVGRPEEVAAVATFLLADESSFVTGAEYAVDGGMAQL